MPIIGGRGAGVRGLGFQGAGAPAQVTGLTATDVGAGRGYNNGAINLSWSTPASNGAPIIGYRIERSTNNSTWSTIVSNTGTSATTYQDSSLLSSQIYYYKVSAINAVGPGLSSSSANATSTTVPQAPTVSVSNVGSGRAYNNGRADITITGGANGGKAISSYSATSSPSSILVSAVSSPITVTGLASSTSYTFSVTATNANGTSTPTVSGSVFITTVPESPTIGTPTVANGQAYTTSANVSVPFTAGATGGATITSYTVTSSSGATASGASSPIVRSDTVGIARTYTVTATNSNGTSSQSSASTSITPISVPQNPSMGTATAGNGSASVTFFPNATGGSAITNYTVTSSPGNITGTGASSPVTVSGLTNGTAYTFTVTATNSSGTSISSAASNSVTPNAYFANFITSSSTNTDTLAGVALDSSGNIYTAGYYEKAGRKAWIGKYNSSGALQWQRHRLETTNAEYRAVAVNPSTGDCFAVGRANNYMSLGAYTTNGNTGNIQEILFGSGPYTSEAVDCALDSSSNLYVIGSGTDAFGGRVLNISKWAASTGGFSLTWSRELSQSGMLAGGKGGNNVGGGIGVDSSGNVYALFTTTNPNNSVRNMVVIKYNSVGTLQWQKHLTSSTESSAGGLSIDSSGNLYVTGKQVISGTDTMVVVKLDTSGNITWQRRLSGGIGTNRGYGIGTDPSGNVYACGEGGSGTAIIFKYNSSGTLQWQRSYNVQGNSGGYGTWTTNLKADNNTVWIAGMSGSDATAYDGLIFKIPADGSKTGNYTYNTKTFNYAAYNATDAAGNLTTSTSSVSDSAGRFAATSGSGGTIATSTTTTINI